MSSMVVRSQKPRLVHSLTSDPSKPRIDETHSKVSLFGVEAAVPQIAHVLASFVRI